MPDPREHWEVLKDSEPGERFREFHDKQEERRGGPWAVSRIAMLVLGVVLLVVGPIVGAIPGPGGMIVFGLGLALVAATFRPLARLLDWLEPHVATLWNFGRRLWRRLPLAARIVLAIGFVAFIVGTWYFGYWLFGM